MEPPTHHEGPISPSLPHVFSNVKIEPTTDHWNPPLIQPVNFSDNTPTYTALEPVYPETSYAPSSTQYFPAISSSTTIQPLYSSCTMPPVDQPLLHNALYRDVDLNQTARDEGLGSSPSSFSSTTPPLQYHQTNANGHIVEPSRPSSNLDYSQRSTSSTPESIASRIEPTTDFWNTPLIQPVNNASKNTPTYAALKPVYPEESYAPSSTHYFPVSSCSSTNQPLYTFCTMPQDYQPSLHTTLYTDVDLNQTARDEGLGSSPSSFSSTPPPLPHHQTNTNGYIVGPSSPSSNLNCIQRSTSSTPESIVFSSYSPECSNCGNRNDIFWYSTHYLCRQCLPERPVHVQQASPVLEDSSKRKRSVATNKNLNQVCTNCEATQSKLWRRSISTGNTVCNACGLYEKLHHVPRPKHMRKDTIQSRKRKPKASRSSPKVKSSSRKNAKKSTSETTLSPQYIPNDVQPTYNLPTYNTLPRDFSSNNTHMLPPINNQTFYAHFRPEMYIYNSVAPNDIINVAQGLPSNIPFSSS